jgi:hypothetical protein
MWYGLISPAPLIYSAVGAGGKPVAEIWVSEAEQGTGFLNRVPILATICVRVRWAPSIHALLIMACTELFAV